jgi:transposase
MRGDDRQPDAMFSYVSPEQRVPSDHPLRAIRLLVDEILGDMSREFDKLYATIGRPSIPPERLLRAQLLQIFYSIRSERLLMEQLDYNILFRWFVGMDMDEPVWAPTVFTKNRDRLLNQAIARSFFQVSANPVYGLNAAHSDSSRFRQKPSEPVQVRVGKRVGRRFAWVTAWGRASERTPARLGEASSPCPYLRGPPGWRRCAARCHLLQRDPAKSLRNRTFSRLRNDS